MDTPSAHKTVSLIERQRALLAANLRSLRQGEELLEQMSDAAYTDSAIGGHIRHILEFYECFLTGLRASCIDYDARRRDPLVQANRHAALARISSLIQTFETDRVLLGDRLLRVRMEDAAAGEAEPFLTSSIGRELQTLSSHTIHHFALIAMMLQVRGYAVDRNFGMAPSTLRYMASAAEAASCAR